ncbi:zinc uptake protein ZrgA [Pacificoceanicola onchidii]|uniref:zinc uptake protein ZrgA n=1 Tax=Pacificoceanicola onchidii TaxID=2562685 RepID=UPI0010A31F8B|nr:DUF2796 domain-containing protein [Pacificoceanicola onchidii]
MKKTALVLSLVGAATPTLAEDTRAMEAHVHGVSKVEIAIDGGTLELALFAPGADIVGFEYQAASVEDVAAVQAGIKTLQAPENVVILPEAAACKLVSASASLRGADEGGHHDDHGHEHDHEDHAHEDHGHDDHGHDDHAHDDHADDEHGHEDHAHDEHAHEDHADDEEASHSEFHANYVFECARPEALTSLRFPFFDTFTNAQEIDAHYVTASGAGMVELTRDTAVLTLK